MSAALACGAHCGVRAVRVRFCPRVSDSSSNTGTSAGFVSSDVADQGAAAAGQKLPEVRDVAVMLLESVKRGQ